MFKRIISLLLVAVTLLSFAACAENGVGETTTTGGEVTTVNPGSTETTTAPVVTTQNAYVPDSLPEQMISRRGSNIFTGRPSVSGI